MSMPIEEHDYIGLSEAIPSSMMEKKKKGGLNLKATELRLGLPGCESPERDCGDSLKIGLTVSSGAKRGFSDAITDRNKWVFPDGSHQDNPITTPGGVPPESPKPAMHENTATIKMPPPPQSSVPASKTQVVGWPPIRASRKNLMAPQPPKTEADDGAGSGCLYVKVSMDGAPYLRKVDLKIYGSYKDLSSALEKMFTCFTIGQCGTNGFSKSRLMDLLHGSEFVLTYEDKDGDWMLVGDVPWQMFTESCKRLRIMKSSDAIGLAPRAMEKCKNRN